MNDHITLFNAVLNRSYFHLSMSTIIFGIHSIEEALTGDHELDKIFVQKDLDSQAIYAILRQAKEKKVGISKVPIQKLNKLTSGNHQGVVAKISPINTESIENLVEKAFAATPTPLFILCDQISDVRNFGAIIRTAECSGSNGIIIPKQGSASINEQAVKTSAGAIFNIPISKVNHLKDAVFFLQSYDVQIVSANEKSSTSFYEVDFKKPTALIMGSEGKGISKSLLKMSDVQAKLPIIGKTDSLNVSVACALFLYEAVRQKL